MYRSQSHQNLTKEKIIEKYGNTDSSLRIRIKNQGYLFIKCIGLILLIEDF